MARRRKTKRNLLFFARRRNFAQAMRTNAMILTLDIGNTRSKLTLWEGQDLLSHTAHTHAATAAALQDLLLRHPAIERVHWCSVGPDCEGVERCLAQSSCSVRRLLPTQAPAWLQLGYRSPHTLGADRMAALMGARVLQPEGALLVIDAGTCITYDLLTADNRWPGGNISPGAALRLRALHEHTARLPLVKPEGEVPLLGHDTPTALRSGVFRGIAYEMEGYLRQLRAEYGEISTFFTGGGDFRSLISPEFRTFADEYLVARGLAAM